MKGDFSRITFDPAKQFCRVLMQQGRVQLDADWNEQAAIVLHEIRSLARALIGPYGGSGDAFKIAPGDADRLFKIAAGVYFVNGIQCETDGNLAPLIPDDAKSKDDPKKIKAGDYVVYLRVAERFITYLKDDSIREKALGEGVDTAARGKIVFAVTMSAARGINDQTTGRAEALDKAIAGLLPPEPRPTLQASLIAPAGPVDRCNVSPDALYRGAANQLYRVEIHDKGPSGTATFKWSRENGSVLFAALAANSQTKQVTLASLGKDDRFTLQKGDWVELEDDDTCGTLPRPPLVQVNSVTPDRNTVTLSDVPVANFAADPAKHPLLRRWEHGKKPWDGGLNTIKEGVEIPLEEGIQVQFAKGGTYWPGDYWVIPARVALGGIDWPPDAFLPAHRPDSGIAPLATITVGGDGKLTGVPKDARSVIQTVAKPV
jgi:hypothetical protein